MLTLLLSLIAGTVSLAGAETGALFSRSAVNDLAPDSAPAENQPAEMAQLIIERRVIIRVPMARPSSNGIVRDSGDEPPSEPEWEEHKGPKCVPIRNLRGAATMSRRGVDLYLRDGSRLRARISKACRPADFYSGFYVEPTADGALCAERDALLARSGMSCPIETFRRLAVEKP